MSSFFMQFRKNAKWSKRIFITFLCLFVSATIAYSLPNLPSGYKKDYDNCRKIDDKEAREECCLDIQDKCLDDCAEGDIDCKEDCAIEEFYCADGPQNGKAALRGPGRGIFDASIIEGVKEAENSLVPDKGYNFRTKSNSLIIEVQKNEESETEHTLVMRCICPEITSTDKSYLCRPFVSNDLAECRICRWHVCEKCTNCTTEIFMID